MPIKDTYKAPQGRSFPEPSWIEEDENAFTSMQVIDQKDSTTFDMRGQTTGTYAPTVSVEVGIRITYDDAAKLCAHLGAMLERAQHDGRWDGLAD